MNAAREILAKHVSRLIASGEAPIIGIPQIYLHGSTRRADGTIDTIWTTAVDSKESPLWWQDEGLSYTATGYGSRIPTRHMIRFNGKWRRVYCRIYSNSGTLYIGRLTDTGENIFVREYM